MNLKELVLEQDYDFAAKLVDCMSYLCARRFECKDEHSKAWFKTELDRANKELGLLLRKKIEQDKIDELIKNMTDRQIISVVEVFNRFNIK